MQHTILTMFSMSWSQPAVVTALPINAPNHFSALLIFQASSLDDEFSLEIFSKGNVVTVVQYNDGIMHLKKDYVMKKAVDLDELVTILKSVVKVKYTKTGNSYTLKKNNQ